MEGPGGTSRPTTLEGRVPPHNMEAERSVLGAILIQNETVDQVRETGLEPGDFYLEAHRRIFDVACNLADRRQPVDLVTLTDGLRSKGWFEAVGGTPALTNLFDDNFAVGNVIHYARIVREKSVLRRMIEACGGIISEAMSGVENMEDFLDVAETKVFSVSEAKAGSNVAPIKSVIMDNMAVIDELATSKKDVTGLCTGFRDFDLMTTGLQPGQIMIVASRPGMGKTSWCLSAIQNAAIQDKAVVMLFSLEMSKEELGFRFLSGLSKIESKRLKTGRLSEGKDYRKLTDAADKLSQARIFIDDSGGLTVMDIRARCRRLLALEKRLDLVVVDYLQLMQGRRMGKGESSREREIAEISRGLKELSKELKVPIIALSQLNRSVEHRQDKRPTLADLRESGAIEQDADMVCFIHRDEYYDKETENRGVAEFIVAKNRNGEPGSIKLTWLGRFTLFTDYAENMPGAVINHSRPDKGDIVL